MKKQTLSETLGKRQTPFAYHPGTQVRCWAEPGGGGGAAPLTSRVRRSLADRVMGRGPGLPPSPPSHPLEASGPLAALMTHSLMAWRSPAVHQALPSGLIKRAHRGAEIMDVTSSPSTMWKGQLPGAGPILCPRTLRSRPQRTLGTTPMSTLTRDCP